MTTIEAIETSYAGYRFRSRLEARWAVVFKTLGIDFDYEPQGYRLGEEGRPYLPDFWLPGLGTWVEVKGEMTGLDLDLMDMAVSYPGGLPAADAYGELGILILGPIPEPGVTALHWKLSRTVYAPGHPESFCACYDLHYSQHAFRSIPPAAYGLAGVDTPERPGADLMQVGRALLRPVWDDIVTARPFASLRPDPLVDAAYRAARSARFEHGESPELPAADPVPVGDDLRSRMAEFRAKHFPVSDGAA